MKLDHVGFVPNSRIVFEDFWCKGLGFKQISNSRIDLYKMEILFGLSYGAECFRYRSYEFGFDIEIHVFDALDHGTLPSFNSFGMNHISLFVDNRAKFLEDLQGKIGIFDIKKAQDSRGWTNIFIRDFEGNWIELREKL